MPYSSLTFVGNQSAATFGLPDTTRRHKTGTILTATDPYWGGAEFIYCYASASIRQGGLVNFLPTSQTNDIRWEATEVANTANLGLPVGIAMVSATVGQYIWIMLSGIAPVNCTASVTAGTGIGIVAAGQGGAIANGKQILGSRSVLAATTTVAKTGVANSGSTILGISGSAGWFCGVYLSGTGIAAATTVTDISPDGTQVTLSAATTAAVNGTVTATYNNATVYYNVVNIDRSFSQGQTT